MKVTAQDLKALGVIDRIVPEPRGGAHRDPEAATRALARAIGEELDALGKLDSATLRARREERFLRIGEM
jgi:acetyl-CoA carboxylase carboxyl transferase subunit alpha